MRLIELEYAKSEYAQPKSNGSAFTFNNRFKYHFENLFDPVTPREIALIPLFKLQLPIYSKLILTLLNIIKLTVQTSSQLTA